MNIILLSPNVPILFSKNDLNLLKRAGKLTIISTPMPFSKINQLQTKEKKIIAIDPDFCNWKVTKNDIKKMRNVSAICLQTTSFNWIDHQYAKKQNIPITNLRNWCTEAVAEWAFLMALSTARKIPLVVKDGWSKDYSKHQGIDLKGKTAGIIGLGNVGTRIAEICQGFGMNVIYWSKNSRNSQFKYVSVNKLMKSADVIFPTLAKNKHTKTIITTQMLKSMKSTALFISIAFNLYDHQFILNQAKTGQIGGYAFEAKEGVNFASFHGNVWAGPALAWVTKESWNTNAKAWIQSIQLALKNNFPTQIN